MSMACLQFLPMLPLSTLVFLTPAATPTAALRGPRLPLRRQRVWLRAVDDGSGDSVGDLLAEIVARQLTELSPEWANARIELCLAAFSLYLSNRALRRSTCDLAAKACWLQGNEST